MDTNDDEPPILKICADGDMLLQARGHSGKVIAGFRVSSTLLTSTSKYYEKLLASSFSEGLRFRDGQKRLHQTHQDLHKTPISILPTVTIPLPEGIDDGKVVLMAMDLLLRAMHRDDSLPQHSEDREFLLHALSSDINLFAHVVALADQLDATEVIQPVADQVLAVQPMCQKKPKKDDADSERYWRQLLYIAYTYKHSRAFLWISGTMILHGPEGQASRNLDAPWHNLPNNVQEEMAVRREGIFSTISSIPNSLLKPYMQADKSRTLLCKMGYDSSLACDSFQLGESIRWLCRRKLVSLNLAMAYAVPEEETFIPDGTPKAMMGVLREFPDYQIDRFHTRCGIRRKLIQMLDLFESMLSDVKQVGLCLDCWCSKNQDDISWSMDKRPNAVPYKGNLAKDLQTVQQLKADLANKLTVQTRQPSGPVKRSIHSPGRVRNLPRPGSINRQAFRNAIHANGDTMADTQRGQSAATDLDDEAEGASSNSVPKVGAKALQDIPTNSICLYIHDHTLYAKVFAPERWVEKMWLTGDETVPSDEMPRNALITDTNHKPSLKK